MVDLDGFIINKNKKKKKWDFKLLINIYEESSSSALVLKQQGSTYLRIDFRRDCFLFFFAVVGVDSEV